MARIGSRRGDVERLLAKGLEEKRKASAGELRELTEEFQGETLHVHQRLAAGKADEVGAWAIVKDTLVAVYSDDPSAGSRESLQRTVAALRKGGAEPSLASAPSYAKVRGHANRPDLLFYLNLEPLIAEGIKAMDIPEPNPIGATKEGVVKALGLDVLQAAYLSVGISEEATELGGGILARERKGLLKLLAFQPGPCPRPPFVPADALAFTSCRFSFKALLEALEEIAGDVSPMVAAQLQMGLQMLTAQTGVDVKKDLLGRLGDEMASMTSFRPGEPGQAPKLSEMDQLFAVSVTDKQGFETALEGLKALAAQGGEPFEKRDFLGATIHTLKAPLPAQPGQAPQHLHYAVTDRFLLICAGTATPLESALASLAKPGPSAWDLPEVKRALGSLPSAACYQGYCDLRRTVGGLVEQCCTLQGTLGMLGRGDGFCDPSARPDADTLGRLWGQGVGAFYQEADGFFLRYRLIHPRAEAP